MRPSSKTFLPLFCHFLDPCSGSMAGPPRKIMDTSLKTLAYDHHSGILTVPSSEPMQWWVVKTGSATEFSFTGSATTLKPVCTTEEDADDDEDAMASRSNISSPDSTLPHPLICIAIIANHLYGGNARLVQARQIDEKAEIDELLKCTETKDFFCYLASVFATVFAGEHFADVRSTEACHKIAQSSFVRHLKTLVPLMPPLPDDFSPEDLSNAVVHFADSFAMRPNATHAPTYALVPTLLACTASQSVEPLCVRQKPKDDMARSSMPLISVVEAGLLNEIFHRPLEHSPVAHLTESTPDRARIFAAASNMSPAELSALAELQRECTHSATLVSTFPWIDCHGAIYPTVTTDANLTPLGSHKKYQVPIEPLHFAVPFGVGADGTLQPIASELADDNAHTFVLKTLYFQRATVARTAALLDIGGGVQRNVLPADAMRGAGFAVHDVGKSSLPLAHTLGSMGQDRLVTIVDRAEFTREQLRASNGGIVIPIITDTAIEWVIEAMLDDEDNCTSYEQRRKQTNLPPIQTLKNNENMSAMLKTVMKTWFCPPTMPFPIILDDVPSHIFRTDVKRSHAELLEACKIMDAKITKAANAWMAANDLDEAAVEQLHDKNLARYASRDTTVYTQIEKAPVGMWPEQLKSPTTKVAHSPIGSESRSTPTSPLATAVVSAPKRKLPISDSDDDNDFVPLAKVVAASTPSKTATQPIASSPAPEAHAPKKARLAHSTVVVHASEQHAEPSLMHLLIGAIKSKFATPIDIAACAATSTYDDPALLKRILEELEIESKLVSADTTFTKEWIDALSAKDRKLVDDVLSMEALAHLMQDVYESAARHTGSPGARRISALDQIFAQNVVGQLHAHSVFGAPITIYRALVLRARLNSAANDDLRSGKALSTVLAQRYPSINKPHLSNLTQRMMAFANGDETMVHKFIDMFSK